jgi:hypothetical protein
MTNAPKSGQGIMKPRIDTDKHGLRAGPSLIQPPPASPTTPVAETFRGRDFAAAPFSFVDARRRDALIELDNVKHTITTTE